MNIIQRATLGFAIVLTLASSPTLAAGIDFLGSLDAAQLLARPAHKPIVIEFNASWCGWCRKMESQTFADQRVQDMASKFIWVQIDIDDQPELAAEFHVRGVPHISVLDHQGIEMTSKSGYMPADDFVGLLEEGLSSELEREVVDEPASADMSDTVSKLIDMLAKPQRGGRDQMLASIASMGQAAWPQLLKSMSSDRLAVRAAAGAALIKSTGATLSFDPFNNESARAEEIAAWERWIEQKQQSKAFVDT